MARITVEDCLPVVPNRFELVMLAARRARALRKGAPTVDPEQQRDQHHKATVTALREFAMRRLKPQVEREALINSLRRKLPEVEPNLDDMTDETEFAWMMSAKSIDDEQATDVR